jgi:hypothetical protein
MIPFEHDPSISHSVSTASHSNTLATMVEYYSSRWGTRCANSRDVETMSCTLLQSQSRCAQDPVFHAGRYSESDQVRTSHLRTVRVCLDGLLPFEPVQLSEHFATISSRGVKVMHNCTSYENDEYRGHSCSTKNWRVLERRRPWALL